MSGRHQTIQYETDQYLKAGRASASLLRIGLYLFILILPLLVALAAKPKTDHPFVQELAKNFAVVGYSIIVMQFVLSARFAWIERSFGLDAVFQFHRCMGMYAAALLLAHPLLYASADKWALLWDFNHPWAISLGKVGFLALGVLAVSSMFRKAVSLEFETWRGLHNGLAFSVLLLGFVHSLFAGGDFSGWPMRTLWAIMLGVAVASYLRRTLLHPQRLALQTYEVVRIEQETHNVWSLEMAPINDARGMRNLPGQFGFLNLYRVGLPIEEHPFTIASAPSASGRSVMTIKASGDYTATIGLTGIGDRASISGPYGRFSYALRPQEKDLVFIAGGVGITPMLSMLRHMRDMRADISVVLLNGNRQERDIIAGPELKSIAEGSHPRLTVVHALSDPGDKWMGVKGRIDGPLVQSHVSQLDNKVFYVCGPPLMTSGIIAALRHMGIPKRSVHIEKFSL